jgi:hypothetical protein
MAVVELMDGQVGLDRRIVYPEGSEDPLAVIQFDHDSEEPFSTNALASDVAVVGWNGTLVPKRSIHLVSVGHIGSMQVIHEAFVGQQSFPFAVASAGKVKGTALDVYSVDSFEALADGVTEDEKKPGNVVANDSSDDSVDLGTATEVSGDVRTAGRVRLSGGAVIKGEQKEGQLPQNLPHIDLAQYDPQGGHQSFVPYTPGMTDIRGGRARYQGDLTLGDLFLDSGLLYVNGNLTITGRVSGTGAIVCNGKVTVTGQMNLQSDLVALVAQGDVLIDGQGKDNGGTRMQGLVYTNGSFKAEDSTVVGAIVSAQVDGTTQLDRVNMVQVPGVTNFEVVVDESLETVTGSFRGEREGYVVGLEHQGSFTPFSESSSAALREVADTLVTLPADQRGTVQVRRTNPDGTIGEAVDDLGGLDRDRRMKEAAWLVYLDKVKANTVERTEIFKLDLNSFLSVQGDLEVLLWKSYRQRVDEQDK